MYTLKGARILVTGGAGFIGSSLVKRLVEDQAEVTVIDLSIDSKSIFAIDRLDRKAAYHTLDVRKKPAVEKFIAKNDFDYIFHLAAMASVLIGRDDPTLTLETNIMGTVHILDAVRKNKNIKGIIVASSDKAYGRTDKIYTEECHLRGSDPFGVSKSSADLICQAYFKTFHIPVVITRFSNVYGEGDLHFDRIIPEICKSIVTGATFRVRSDGTFRRDYIYIHDVVNGYLTLLHNIQTIHGEAYNFSSRDNLSVKEVIAKARSALNADFPYIIMNTAKNELPYQHLDDRKVQKLGWQCQYSFEEVFPRILSWYREVLR